MDPRSFDRIAKALACRQGRRRAPRAVALALAAPVAAAPARAQRYPPICGQEGGHCTRWAPCCSGLACVTLPLNPNFGVCRGGGASRSRRSGAGVSADGRVSFAVEVDCYGNLETTTVTNTAAASITVQSITSLNDARDNREAHVLNDVVRPSRSIIYQSGSRASRNVLTREHIYDDGVGSDEGASVMASGAIETVRCITTAM